MRFKIDENLPDDNAILLRVEGYEARTISEQGARGIADPALAHMCMENDEILVTMDMDFADSLTYPPSEFAGFLIFRTRALGKSEIIGFFRNNLQVLKTLELRHHLTIISDIEIRIYPGD